MVKPNRERKELDKWESPSSITEGKAGCMGIPEDKRTVLVGSASKLSYDCFSFLSVKIEGVIEFEAK